MSSLWLAAPLTFRASSPVIRGTFLVIPFASVLLLQNIQRISRQPQECHPLHYFPKNRQAKRGLRFEFLRQEPGARNRRKMQRITSRNRSAWTRKLMAAKQAINNWALEVSWPVISECAAGQRSMEITKDWLTLITANERENMTEWEQYVREWLKQSYVRKNFWSRAGAGLQVCMWSKIPFQYRQQRSKRKVGQRSEMRAPLHEATVA
jgi:hypothetical protein